MWAGRLKAALVGTDVDNAGPDLDLVNLEHARAEASVAAAPLIQKNEKINRKTKFTKYMKSEEKLRKFKIFTTRIPASCLSA